MCHYTKKQNRTDVQGIVCVHVYVDVWFFCVCVHMCMFVCVSVYACVYKSVCVCVCVYKRVHFSIRAGVGIDIHVWLCLWTFVCKERKKER